MFVFTVIAYTQLAIYSVLDSYLPAYLLTHCNYVPLMLMYMYIIIIFCSVMICIALPCTVTDLEPAACMAAGDLGI